MTKLSSRLRLALAASILAVVLPSCGGSSSETPPPVEPTPRELAPRVESNVRGGENASPRGAESWSHERHHADAGLF